MNRSETSYDAAMKPRGEMFRGWEEQGEKEEGNCTNIGGVLVSNGFSVVVAGGQKFGTHSGGIEEVISQVWLLLSGTRRGL